MRPILFLGVTLAVTAACGGTDSSGQGQSGQNNGGASSVGGASSTGGASSVGGSGVGGGSNGGATGMQCTTSAECPQLGCYMCPAYICVSGQCVPQSTPGNGGATGVGGAASGNLKWFSTCGPPVCRAPIPGSGGSPSTGRACSSTETEGTSCTTLDATCDTGASCSGPLKCATSDPTNGGQCPVSRAKYKTDIQYVTPRERAKLAEDVQSIPLVRYRYKAGPEREHLGFIIEDVEPSPSVDSENDRVDLYGYTTMAIAALQEQNREIAELKREIRELKGEMGMRGK